MTRKRLVLTTNKYLKLGMFLSENKDKYIAKNAVEIAREATDFLGFEVTYSHIETAAESIGISYLRFRKDSTCVEKIEVEIRDEIFSIKEKVNRSSNFIMTLAKTYEEVFMLLCEEIEKSNRPASMMKPIFDKHKEKVKAITESVRVNLNQ